MLGRGLCAESLKEALGVSMPGVRAPADSAGEGSGDLLLWRPGVSRLTSAASGSVGTSTVSGPPRPYTPAEEQFVELYLTMSFCKALKQACSY